MHRVAALVLVLGCGDRGERTASPTKARDGGAAMIDAGVPAPLVRASHTGEISLVAASDDGGVAFTADQHGELRFWPSLDGANEPVVVRGNPPDEIALAHDRDGYIVAVLDAASGVELLRLAPDGALRARQKLPAEPGFVDVVSGKAAILARRSDHVIARLDKPGTLAPEMGEQVLAIAARRDHAVAAIADPDRPNEIKRIRRLDLRGGLAWGEASELPVPLSPPIAISPSGGRLAGLHARTGAGVVVELGAKPRVVASDIVGSDTDDDVIGFLDDERAVMRGGIVVEAPQATTTVDPWNGTKSTSRVRLGRGPIVVDRMLLAGQGTHLVLADPATTRFLGYRDLGVGFLRVTGKHITLGFGNRVLWLDDKLDLVRSRDVLNDAAGGIGVSDRHLLKGMYSYLENDRSKFDVMLVDATTGREDPLGSWSQASTLTYDPSTSVFAVSGYMATIARSQLDLANGKATPLRPLKPKFSDAAVELLDPSVADGQIAVAYSFATDVGIRIDTFVDDKGKGPITPATSARVDDVAYPLGVDQAGTLFMLAARPEPEQKPVYGYRAGKAVKRFVVDASIAGGTVDRKGSLLALFSNSELWLFDVDGNEKWRVPAWSINVARFTDDGKTLIVNTQGGLFTIDVATGKRVSTGCSWGFGISTTEPQMTVFLSPVVCAEGI